MTGATASAATVSSPGRTIVLVLLFVTLTLTAGRWLIAKILGFIRMHTSGRGAVLGLIFTLTLASAGFAEYAGIHAGVKLRTRRRRAEYYVGVSAGRRISY